MPSEPLQQSISFILIELCKTRRALSETLLGEVGLHAGQDMLFVSLLQQEGLIQTELAERLQIQRATLTAMVQRLEKAGLIERKVDPSDQRALRVYTTEAGRALQDNLQRVWDRIETLTTQDMSVEERIILRRLLLQAYDNLQKSR